MVSRVSFASILMGVSADPSWTEFKARHGRVFGAPLEESSRYETFSANAKIVEEVNSKGLPYRLAMNKFADWTHEEYKGLLGFVPRPIPAALHLGTHYPSGKAAPSSIDWVAKGAVTPVKDQGQCGSCWAFSTTGGVEGAWQVATGKLVELSEQELVDCSTANNGCNGGLMDKGFEYLEGQNICTESAYPYHASDGSCKLPCSDVAIPRGGVKGYTDVSGGESGLLSAIQNQPISVAVDAAGSNWQLYSGGVMTSQCGTSLDHGVLAVGYGTDGGNDYWKVKNSWGTGWGEAGYIRIVRGRNSCGISNMASYPQVDGNTPPTPPSPPSPSPSPDDCKDVFPDCDILKDICNDDPIMREDCKKTCGFCTSVESPPGGIFDDILKLVCQLMENGSTEPEAEKLICSKLHYNVEVTACDKVVDLLWKEFEGKECPAGAKPYETPESQFEHFMQKFNKNYRDEDEKKTRFEIFKQNLVHIIAKNARENGQATFAVNSLSDLSPAEFKRNYLGLQIPANMHNLSMFVPRTGSLAPSSMDWVSRGAVTPVKDQGQCGSCWTFSTTGAIEGAWQIATGRLVSLSEQQIVDCASSAGQGCSGGWPNRAIQWEESQAICGENEYRYTARDGSCHACSSPVLARGSVTGVQYVSASTNAMKAALAETPVSVCVDAEEWSYYSGGIFSNCGTSLDHAVLAVGYDSSSWKVKNSWGAGWGERGYIRLALGDTCGVLDNAVVALVSGSKAVVV